MRCSITAGVSTSAIQGMFECHAVQYNCILQVFPLVPSRGGFYVMRYSITSGVPTSAIQGMF